MKKWTNEEIYILKNNYKIKSRKDLCEILPDRNWHAIRIKACRLKISSSYKLGTFQQRFDGYIGVKKANQCWNWTGSCNKKGYGKIKINGRSIIAHRFSWEVHFGNIPDGLFVCHECDNPKCVNPNHLFLGDHQTNMDDMVAKNRQARGESVGSHKLTTNQVKEIKQLRNKLTQVEIGKLFNVGHSIVSAIHNNKTWKHIK